MTTGEVPDVALTFPVDGHVHFHRRELVSPTLEAAAANFLRVSTPGATLLGALLLAESSREHVFEQLGESRRLGRWRLERLNAEAETVIASSEEGSLAIVAGKQVRCALGVEVIALGTTKHYSDGGDLREQVAQVVSDGKVAVVPWGFGKWIGRAGRIVADAFSNCERQRVFAGDNGGRMQLLGRPRLLSHACGHGVRVLPGTDPFPFGGDYRRVGTFGFMAPPPEARRPWSSVHDWLVSGGSPHHYGRALNPPRFLFNQAWIQVHNRIASRSAQ